MARPLLSDVELAAESSAGLAPEAQFTTTPEAGWPSGPVTVAISVAWPPAGICPAGERLKVSEAVKLMPMACEYKLPTFARAIKLEISLELVSTVLATPFASVVEADADNVPLVPMVATEPQFTVTPLTGLPYASLTVALRVEVLVPLGTIALAEALAEILAIWPAVKVTAVVAFTAPMLACTVASPALVELVSTMVATPLLSVGDVVSANVPVDVVQLTLAPLIGLP